MDCSFENICLGTELCPTPDSLINNFSQLLLCKELEIPQQKPDIEYLSKEMIEICLSKVEVIDVNLGDGVSRKKIIFQGDLKLGVEYSADMPEQEVHFAHYDIPFQGFMGERPCTALNKGLISDPAFNLSNYNIHYCVEHAQYHQIDKRKFKPVIVLLVWLEPKTP